MWHGSTWKLAVPPGPHRLRMAIDWGRSREVGFDVQPGETARFRCGPSAGSWRIFYDMTIGWNRYVHDLRGSGFGGDPLFVWMIGQGQAELAVYLRSVGQVSVFDYLHQAFDCAHERGDLFASHAATSGLAESGFG